MAIQAVPISETTELVKALAPFLTALVAAATLLLVGMQQVRISKIQNKSNWARDFLKVYIDFWENDEMAKVRYWIISNEGYEEIKSVLARWLSSPQGSATRDDSEILELIDRFCAKMTVYDAMNNGKGSLSPWITWSDRHRAYWYNLLENRPELYQYVQKAWPGMLDSWEEEKAR